ncbi:MAG TPA: hypothetical protein EYQ75_23135 [Planctomycetaceae bacterium]|nr:hypothetical protein [Planctomycetaceae bacterium]
MCINGVTAYSVASGDLVIIVSYAVYEESELSDHTPRVYRVDELNRILE